jgi:hypothetical protein
MNIVVLMNDNELMNQYMEEHQVHMRFFFDFTLINTDSRDAASTQSHILTLRG